MLYKLYCWIGRTAYKLAFPIMKILPFSPRVRVVLLNERNQILVVKNWFGPQTWSLPGGGIGRRETHEQAAVREIHEETGLRMSANQLTAIGTYSKSDLHAAFAAHCLKAVIQNQAPHVSRWRKAEILDVAWVDVSAVGTEIGKILRSIEL